MVPEGQTVNTAAVNVVNCITAGGLIARIWN